MTNEERDLITRFIERVGGQAASGSVPGSGAQALPPIDRDADALIADLFNRNPEARYRLTQLAFVQEHALASAQQRIKQLEQAQQATQQPAGGGSPWGQPAGQQPQQSRGFFSTLFGGGAPSRPAAPPPQYAPAPQQMAPQYAPPQGMMQPQGSGFLGGALQTAAGVAGGVVAGNALMSLFSGNHGGGGMFGGVSGPDMGGGFGGGGFGGGGGAGGPDPFDRGGEAKGDPSSDPFAAGGGGGGVVDQSAWEPSPDQGGGGWQPVADDNGGGGWTDTGGDAGGGGGWTDSGGGDGGSVDV